MEQPILDQDIDARMANFEVRESNSALRNFARVYSINGIEGYDARSFLKDARQKKKKKKKKTTSVFTE